MTFSGFSFCCWRIWQIITLIPMVGMLAWFIDWYTDNNQVVLRPILILFIISVLGAAWAAGTLFLYTRAKHSAGFVALVDLLFFGAFIGAVYDLRHITQEDCTSARADRFYANFGLFQVTGPGFLISVKKPCMMIKTSFAFGIMNVIFFALTFFFALLVHRHYDSEDRVVVKRETHVSRRSHRGHRSRSPRHSHHSSRRSYHV